MGSKLLNEGKEGEKEKSVEITLNVPGKHNVSNAAGVFALGDQLGLSWDGMKRALESYRSVRRRFDVLFQSEEYMVVDDYAHHPTEIRATLAAAKKVGRKRVVAAFQPHRYSRTLHLKGKFAEAFGDADEVFVTEIYAASEEPIEGVSGEGLAEELGATFCKDLKQLRTAVSSILRPGDLLLVMGAGDVDQTAHQIAGSLKRCEEVRGLVGNKSAVRPFEPMDRHTTMKVGGGAEIWCEPNDEAALSKILSYCCKHSVPVTIVGRGTNLLVRDGGIPGVCVHLKGEYWERIEMDGAVICAGAGARLRQIVAEAKKTGVGGLEFMEGIPGSLGGALRMNAGAMDSWIFELVKTVRFMDMEGKAHSVLGNEVKVEYRNAPLFETNIALSAVLEGTEKKSEEIEQKLKAFSEKRRFSQPGGASAGCIFRNPQGIAAGKLIDELGLKNTAYGRARISPVHGNFIVNEGGARAEEILHLMEMIQKRAREERGIELKPEVKILGE